MGGSYHGAKIREQSRPLCPETVRCISRRAYGMGFPGRSRHPQDPCTYPLQQLRATARFGLLSLCLQWNAWTSSRWPRQHKHPRCIRNVLHLHGEHRTAEPDGCCTVRHFLQQPAPSLFATPFIDRSTGFDNGQRYPGVTIPAPPPPSHPNDSINWPQYLPIASYAWTWYKNHVPYSEDYNLSIQRQLGPNSLLMIAYVGTQGHSLLGNEEANPGDPALCLSVSQPSQVAPNSATCGPFGENGVYTRTDGTVINSTGGPLGPAFASDAYWISIAASNYNSLQLTWKYRTGPLEFLAGYTWSKSIDNSSAWTDMINLYDHRRTRALSGFNVPQNFVVSYSYALPFADYLGQHRLTNGWVLSGITRFSSGQPVTMSEQDDNSLLGTEGSGDSAGLDVPDFTPGNLQVGANPRACVTNPNCQPYFNTSLFSLENIGVLGNSNHRFITGPGINNFDMALLKDTHITGDKLIELRFECFNLFNHAQFLTPSGTINSSVFGVVTGAGNPRIVQLAAKVVF